MKKNNNKRKIDGQTRINDFEEFGKGLTLREYLISRLLEEYRFDAVEKMIYDKLKGQFPKTLEYVDETLSFIRDTIFPTMPTSKLMTIGHGTWLKEMLEEYIVGVMKMVVCSENETINTYISAEPSSNADEYWDEWNWAWIKIYEGCGFTLTNEDYSVNEFELVHNYITNKEGLINSIKKAFGEEYFPTEEKFVLTYEITAKTYGDAVGMLARYLINCESLGSTKSLVKVLHNANNTNTD